MRGATPFICKTLHLFLFQSTRPMRGATVLTPWQTASSAFQSTRPMRGATGDDDVLRVVVHVSIHAPHAGRDRFILHFLLP